MKIQPNSLHRDIAQHFWLDARDFANRFDALWEHEGLMGKTGRFKTFVDLLIGCECALKAHAFLSPVQDDPVKLYTDLRQASHNIAKLAGHAQYLSDRSTYEQLKDRLAPLSVSIRYSLDAYQKLLPFFPTDNETEALHSQTLGNAAWICAVRKHLKTLIDTVRDEVTGEITGDPLESADQLSQFYKTVNAPRSRRK